MAKVIFIFTWQTSPFHNHQSRDFTDNILITFSFCFDNNRVLSAHYDQKYVYFDAIDPCFSYHQSQFFLDNKVICFRYIQIQVTRFQYNHN